MRERPKGKYRSVIVDEALDFNLVGMPLIRALVAGKEDNPLSKSTVLGLEAMEFPKLN